MFGKVKEVKTGCPRFQNLTSLWLSTRRKADRRLPKADYHSISYPFQTKAPAKRAHPFPSTALHACCEQSLRTSQQ